AGLSVPAFQTTLSTNGYTTPGDAGAARYRRVATQPTHGGKLQSADGAWWELAETAVTPEMFGAVGNGTADDFDAVARWADFINHKAGTGIT
ncbi:hypothetical protein, partial [Streptomyces niveiscabiei]|uniref:hypothetical protein n=1 Tax=Streptomyces niveiscabiei TaxID=164115 RepID=UPI0038F6E199